MGWKDSNLQYPGPEPGVLPLDYTPVNDSRGARTRTGIAGAKGLRLAFRRLPFELASGGPKPLAESRKAQHGPMTALR
jgi:hypothetical protein